MPPSGETAIAQTPSVCPSKVAMWYGEISTRTNSVSPTSPSVSTTLISIGCAIGSERLETKEEGMLPS